MRPLEREGRIQVAIVGCGFIADHYVQSLRRYPMLELVGAADRDLARSRRFGAFHACHVYGSVDELLGDGRTRIILNLTNPSSHFEVSRAGLLAGKNIYSEKPLAMKLDQARELVELAAARGLRIASAPCNLLGESAQTMWKALREGKIGRVRAVYAEMDDGLLHRMPYSKWHSASGIPWPFRDEFEVGCTLEHAGYSLTLLAAFFGPARSVTAFSSVQIPDKLDPGVDLAPAPDLSVATVVFESGVVARLTCSIIAPHDHALRIFGDGGVLFTPDVWRYDSPVFSRRWRTIRRKMFLSPWRTRHARVGEPGRTVHEDDRARGVAELAAAISEQRPCRLSAELALHVTEMSLAIQNAGPSAGAYRMTTRFDPIAPMPWSD
jgi:predicted dehydrogenase